MRTASSRCLRDRPAKSEWPTRKLHRRQGPAVACEPVRVHCAWMFAKRHIHCETLDRRVGTAVLSGGLAIAARLKGRQKPAAAKWQMPTRCGTRDFGRVRQMDERARGGVAVAESAVRCSAGRTARPTGSIRARYVETTRYRARLPKVRSAYCRAHAVAPRYSTGIRASHASMSCHASMTPPALCAARAYAGSTSAATTAASASGSNAHAASVTAASGQAVPVTMWGSGERRGEPPTPQRRARESSGMMRHETLSAVSSSSQTSGSRPLPPLPPVSAAWCSV